MERLVCSFLQVAAHVSVEGLSKYDGQMMLARRAERGHHCLFWSRRGRCQQQGQPSLAMALSVRM